MAKKNKKSKTFEPTPVTRSEKFLAAIAGLCFTAPEPITRREYWLKHTADRIKAAEEGGGSTADFLKLVGAMVSDVVIDANGRVNVQVPIQPPEGYWPCAYRSITLSGAAANRDVVVIQMFGTSGGGQNATVGLINTSDRRVLVNVTVEMIACKEIT